MSATACRVTIPPEEPASSKWRETLGEDTALNVYQCADHLNSLRTKAQLQVYLGNGLALLAGGTTIISGLLSATLKDDPATAAAMANPTDSLDGGLSKKETLALTAAIAGLLTLVGTYVGNPSDTLVGHSRRQKHYATVRNLIPTTPLDRSAINAAAGRCTTGSE